MLSNSSNPPDTSSPSSHTSSSVRRRILMILGLPVWVFLGFMVAQALAIVVVAALQASGMSFDGVDPTILNTVAGATIYALAILIVIGVPYLVKKQRTTAKELGVHRFPTWMDIVWAPAGAVTYVVLTSIVSAIAMALLPFVDYSQVQDTGFAQISGQSGYILAFISLVLVAPVAEEVLFRGYLFGKLRKYAPLWVAILVTSLLFGIVHFQWNVSIDVFALSIVLCLLRVVSGSLWPSILLHMLKNGIAFYFLFINPSLLSTLGG